MLTGLGQREDQRQEKRQHESARERLLEQSASRAPAVPLAIVASSHGNR
jgi:hypothetical protein